MCPGQHFEEKIFWEETKIFLISVEPRLKHFRPPVSIFFARFSEIHSSCPLEHFDGEFFRENFYFIIIRVHLTKKVRLLVKFIGWVVKTAFYVYIASFGRISTEKIISFLLSSSWNEQKFLVFLAQYSGRFCQNCDPGVRGKTLRKTFFFWKCFYQPSWTVNGKKRASSLNSSKRLSKLYSKCP